MVSYSVFFLITLVYKAFAETSTSAASVKNQFKMGCIISADQKQRLMTESASWQFQNKIRVCNSDDKALGINDCIPPVFPEYNEIRFAPGNWESAIVLAWIYQILLSEVLGVPATIEAGDGERDARISFYDPEERFSFPDQVYPAHHLVEASRHNGNCNLSNTSCAHVLPEIWSHDGNVIQAQKDGHILGDDPNGIIGNVGYYIPKFTAMSDPSLTSFYGISGEVNRQKVVSTFKTPMNWYDYCTRVSMDNCTTANQTAAFFPRNEEEGQSYFVQDLFEGFFQKNNCTNETECTGHVIAPPCTWHTFLENQFFWNEIHLSSRGPVAPNNGYSHSQMVQIYKAANATKNHVIIWWWGPDMLVEKFANEEFEFQRIMLPTPTEKCLTYRAETLSIVRCTDDKSERIGKELGSCDYPFVSLRRVISKGLKTATFSVPEEIKSPAFEFMQQLSISEYTLHTIFREWSRLEKENISNPGRIATCNWVKDNLDDLIRFVPDGYPRNRYDLGFAGLSYAGYVIGSIAMVMVLVTTNLLYKYRKHLSVQATQIHVTTATTIGYCLIALASILSSSNPSDTICIMTHWWGLLGYTLALFPLLLKISAINKLGRQARRFRRAKIDPKAFRQYLTVIVTLVVIYLVIWTIFDPPKAQKTMVLDTKSLTHFFGKTTKNTQDDVISTIGCASTNMFWILGAFAWQCIILLSTTVLTYQSRQIILQLREKYWFAALVYSHFLFLLLRTVVVILITLQLIPTAAANKVMGMLLGGDTIFAISLYFVPLFYGVITGSNSNSLSTRGLNSSSNRGNSIITSGRGSVTYVTGVKIPDGGIPNLIVANKNDEVVVCQST